MNPTRTTSRRLALAAGFAMATVAGLSIVQVAAADVPVGARDADARADVGRDSYYASRAGTPADTVLTRANLETNAAYGRSSVYAFGVAHSGTIIGAADPGQAVLSRPDPARPGRQ